MDWTLIQSFLAVAETGSLSAAARQLQQSQPTLGRHIRTLEADLQSTLFQRHQRGLRLTEAGAALLPHAHKVRDSVQQLMLAAAGQDVAMEGTVRLTASLFAAHYVLPPILAQLRHAAPGIDLELHASDSSDNLLYRDADIAVRMYRPTQLDLVAQHLGDLQMGCFAARSYVAWRPDPITPDRLFDHDVVGFDRDPLILNAMQALGLTAKRTDFAVRCDNQSAYWALVRAGCGVGFAQRDVGRRDPEMIEIDLGLPLPTLPIWLAAPEAVRHVPRLQRVWSLLGQHLRAYVQVAEAKKSASGLTPDVDPGRPPS